MGGRASSWDEDRVVEIGSVEEAFDIMRERTDAANAAVLPVQREVTWGSHWVTYNPPTGVLIFGYVYTQKEFLAEERKAGADTAEADYSLRHIQGSYERGYRFGMCYSEVVPEGEPGSTHLVTMFGPITKEQFEEARAEGWNTQRLMGYSWLKQLVERGRTQAGERS